VRDSHILLRKVVSPGVPQTILHRKSLIEKLNTILAGWDFEAKEDIPHCKLVLLCAPAGYGKTTLLVDFTQHTSIPCCWYFLDPSDADKISFLEFLLASIRHRFPHFGATLDPLLTHTINHPTDPHHLDALIDALVDAIAIEITERFVLLLCNYHEVNDCASVNELVNQLLRKIPPHCVLIIESRAIPSLDLASLQVHREFIGWDSSVLRFTAQEISELAILQHMPPLSESEAEQLAVSFDGWIAGILLGTHLGDVEFLHKRITRPNIPSTHASAMTQKDRQGLFIYLINEVFGREPEMYTFLKEVTLLQHMDPSICARLLDIPDAVDRLDYLEQQGMFVTRRNDDPQIIYTCHPILRELLRDELRYQSPERFISLHRRAAEIFHELHDYDQAIYHAHAIGANDMIAKLIIEASTQMFTQGYTATLIRWIDMLPQAAQERYPEILLISAKIYLISGEYAQAIPLLDTASLTLANNSSSDIDNHALLSLQPHITITRSKALFQKGAYQEAQNSCLQVLVHLPENEMILRIETHTRLGMCANLLGDFTSGITHLQKALQLSGRPSEGQQVADIHGALASTYNQIGNIALAEHHLIRAINCCNQLNDEHGKVNNLIRMGLIKNNQGALDEAETFLTQALTSATQLRFERGAAYALVNLGGLYQDMKRYDQSLIATEDGLVLARRVKDKYLMNCSLCTLAMTYLLMGDASTARLLISEVDPPAISENSISYERVKCELTSGMILLYQHSYDEAYACLTSIEPAVKKLGVMREQVHVTLLIAACQLAQGRQMEVIRHMGEMTQLLVTHDGYERLVHIEFMRLPELLHFVRAHPEMVHLRGLLHLDPTVKVSEDFSTSTLPALIHTHMVADHPKIKIQTLGEPLVILNTVPIVRWRMRRSLEVFLFLLDKECPMSKEQIITALWPHIDEKTNPTFHSMIYHLRKTIGEACVISQAGTYALNLASLYGHDVWYDVAAFEKLYTQAKRARTSGDDVTAQKYFLLMVDLYQGNYVQSFYSDWCILRRDELQHAYLDARSQLAHIAWQHERFDESAFHWQKVLSVDNCLEEAHYGLMRYYLRHGKRGLALRQYQRCADVLRQELAISPGPTIQNLYQRLIGLSSSLDKSS